MFLFVKNLNKKKISKQNKGLDTEEVFWDAFLSKKKSSVFKKKLAVPLSARIVFYLRIVFVLVVLLTLAKTCQFQIYGYEKYSEMAERNKFAVYSLQSHRGVFYDKNFNQIVVNRPSFDLVFQREYYPENQEQGKEILEKVAWILNKDAKELKDKLLFSDEKEMYVLRGLDYRQLILLESNIEELKGFFIHDSSVRDYIDGPMFSHILGYHRRTGPGAGLELYYNEQLSPKPGKVMAERDVYGNILGQETMYLPEPGNSLILHLDSEFQEFLYKTMEKEMKQAEVKKGVAVAMDPNTGGVLAMVSFPTYDNNLFSRGISSEAWDQITKDRELPLVNRAIAGKYPSGSVIKPLVGLAALEEQIINPRTSFNCAGEIVIENPWNPDEPTFFRDWAVHGITDIRKAIAQSCNVFFYTVGGGYENFKGLGADKIKEYLSLFGWNEKTGIDLPGESSSFVPDRMWKRDNFSSPQNIWTVGDTYHLSIGQSYLTATPLAVNSSMATIANKGTLFRPQMVQRIIDKDKEVVEEIFPEIVRDNFISPENMEIVRLGMRDAVTYGSAVALNSLPVTAGAKTGTAEIGKPGFYHNWISVFAPYENPEIVITIMLEEVEGLRVAVIPVVRQALEWYFGERGLIEEKNGEGE